MKYLMMLLILLSGHTQALEDWQEPYVNIAGYYHSDMKSEYRVTTRKRGLWYLNAWDDGCKKYVGRNECFATHNGKLYFHGEKGGDGDSVGDGSLLVSKRINFTSGISVEATLRVYCIGACWANIGIYRGEGNYRSIGYKSHRLNIWGPLAEKALQSQDEGVNNKYKITYWFDGARWRWDYHINDVWVAGHFAEDYEYKMGLAYFADNNARIALGFGAYRVGGYSEGEFGPIKVTAW